MKKIVLALILVEQFEAMTEICASRKSCIGCPFFKGNVCGMVSTRRALKASGEVIRQYLYEEGYYPINKKEFEAELKELLLTCAGSSSLHSENKLVGTIQRQLLDAYRQSP